MDEGKVKEILHDLMNQVAIVQGQSKILFRSYRDTISERDYTEKELKAVRTILERSEEMSRLKKELNNLLDANRESA